MTGRYSENFPDKFIKNVEVSDRFFEPSSEGERLAEILHDRGMNIGVGLSLALQAGLSIVSSEPHNLEFNPEDRQIFGSRAKTAEWLDAGKLVVSINELAIAGKSILLAYTRLGSEPSEHLPRADVLMQPRISLRGKAASEKIKTTTSRTFDVGSMVLAAAALVSTEKYGVHSSRLRAESWLSDRATCQMIEQAGFEKQVEIPAQRKTLRGPATNPENDALVPRQVDDRRVLFTLPRQ